MTWPQITFEYTICKFIESYMIQKDIKTIQEFNQRNNFSRHKILLLPFFVCVSGNGSGEKLYDLWDGFKATKTGPVVNTVSTEELTFFRVSTQGLQIEDSYTTIHTLKEAILKQREQSSNVAFRDYLLEYDDNKKYFEAIDAAMGRIKKRYTDFASWEPSNILRLAIQFRSYSDAFRYDPESKIKWSEIESDENYSYFSETGVFELVAA